MATLLGVLATVLVSDQLLKAWAWRQVGDVHINAGGDLFVGATLDAWYAGPLTGALLDVADTMLLACLAGVLVRRARSRLALTGGALLIAGWGSNLADRLGVHFWTAPGSERGVVDYVPWDSHYWNLADLVIAVGSLIFTAALVRDVTDIVRSAPLV